MLLAKGTHPKIVLEMLRHASIVITLDTYSHVLPTMGEVAARAIQRAFAEIADSDISRG